MKLTCIVDNAVLAASPLWGEHGLSYLIETPEGRLLFDTGQSGTVLLHNLQIMDVDPLSIDALAISHGHYDHTGGLPALLEHVRPGIPLYASPDLFRARYARKKGELKSIGCPLSRDEVESRVTLKLDAAPQQVFEGVWTTGEIAERSGFSGGSDQHFVREGGTVIPDAYRDDMSLVLQSGEGLTLLCGCCHAGLLNTLLQVERTFEPAVTRIIGGTHLMSASAGNVLRCAAHLSAMPRLRHVHPGHCTGEDAILVLARTLGRECVHSAPAGTTIVPGENVS